MKKILISVCAAAALLLGAVGLTACGAHKFDTEWSYDNNRHWHACIAHKNCKERGDLALHTFVEGESEEEGKKTFICTGCFYTKTESPLDTPVVKLSENVLTWDEVLNATGYDIYRNGEKITSASGTSHIIRETEAGGYVYSVVATTNKAGYCASDRSNSVTYEKFSVLGTPELVANEKQGTLGWTSVSHATGYKVYFRPDGGGDEIVRDAESSPYTVTEAQGKYYVTVQAVSSDKYYTAGDKSNEVEYTVAERLPAPKITLRAFQLTWNTVENATGYRVYRDGFPMGSTQTENYYTIYETEPGNHIFTVTAMPNPSDIYLESSPSNEVSFYMPAIKQLDVDGTAAGSPIFGCGEIYCNLYHGFFLEFTGELNKEYVFTVNGSKLQRPVSTPRSITIYDHETAKKTLGDEGYVIITGLTGTSDPLLITGRKIFVAYYYEGEVQLQGLAQPDVISVSVKEAPASAAAQAAEITLALPPEPVSLKKRH